jgi:hypothetical protein
MMSLICRASSLDKNTPQRKADWGSRIPAHNIMDTKEVIDRIFKESGTVLEPPLHVLCAYGEAANDFLDVLVRDDIDIPET